MQPVREVYSLLMPVQDGRIIVPRAAVAEVMGYTTPKRRPEDAPAFVLGYIDWQGQQVPLVSFEAARGKAVPERNRRARIAVVFGIAGRLEPDVFAVVTQGYPYLVRVNENVLQKETVDADDPLILARVRMANEKPLIPDLEALEHRIADGLGLEAPGAKDAAPADELDVVAGEEEEDWQAGALDDVSDEAADENTVVNEAVDFDIAVDGESDAMENDTETDVGIETNTGTIVDIDPNTVTDFGSATNYSAELEELSSTLDSVEDGDTEANALAADDDYAIDLSGLEVAGDETAAADTDGNESDAAGEIDFSDLSIDLDEDQEKDEEK